MALVAIFDFLSHEFMHHPFNEGYLRVVRAAFPGDEIVFHAGAAHVARLRERFGEGDGVTFRACAPFGVAFGQSRHNPVGGRIGAWRCWRAVRAALREAGGAVRLVAVLGVDANLYSVMSRCWPGGAPLHLVMHGHIGEAMRWRSRNPLFRAFDLVSTMRRRLAGSVKIVVLELGIREAILARAPHLAGSVETLEHPILEAEWREPPEVGGTGPLRVAFLGHSSVAKGFDRFAAWAARFARPGLEFHAIGIAAPEAAAMDLSGLTTRPSQGSVPREAYVAGLASCDVVCLPLPRHTYEFVASGTVIDAIAALKPLFCISNRSLAMMAQRHGAIGVLAEDEAGLERAIEGLERAGFEAAAAGWIAAARRVRESRRPAVLAVGYGAMVRGSGVQDGGGAGEEPAQG